MSEKSLKKCGPNGNQVAALQLSTPAVCLQEGGGTIEGVQQASFNFICGAFIKITVELVYKVMKKAEYFVSLYTSVVIHEEYDVTVNSKELIGTTEHLTL